MCQYISQPFSFVLTLYSGVFTSGIIIICCVGSFHLLPSTMYAMEQHQQHQQRQTPRVLLLGRPSPPAMPNSGKNKQALDVVPSLDSSTIMRLTNIEAPTNLDVLCGRGVATNRHVGNESFRALVKCHKVRASLVTLLLNH